MKIVILRHGKPSVPDIGKLRAGEFFQWINLYNSAGINEDHKPSSDTLSIAADCNVAVCSDLKRSPKSDRLLAP